MQWVVRLFLAFCSVDTSQFAFTNGKDLFIYDLLNPSQAFKVVDCHLLLYLDVLGGRYGWLGNIARLLSHVVLCLWNDERTGGCGVFVIVRRSIHA